MKKWMFTTAILSSFLMLNTGCQNKQNASMDPAPVKQTSDVSVQPSQQALPSTPTASMSPQPILPAESPTPAPAAANAGANYKINKIYDVVPFTDAGNKKVVLLTFDDGPKEKAMLTQMLDILDKHHAKAIFFVNGYRVKQNPDLLKLLHDKGQVIGNHSWDHIDLKKQTNEKIDQQILDVQKIVKDLTGTAPVFFRPPHGSANDHVKSVVKDQKMVFMTWSNGSLDWESPSKDKPQVVIDNVLKQLRPGSNILMHELQWTANALDKLLTEIEAKGYSFVDPNQIRE